jgi:hypothetical protein
MKIQTQDTQEQNIREHSIREQSIRDHAYQIWESEGRPIGHDFRHWEMACKLIEGMNNKDSETLGSGHLLSVIAPEETNSSIPGRNSTPVDSAQPDDTVTTMKPYASKRTSKETVSALAEDGVKPAPVKKQTKPRKTKTAKDQDSVNV